MSFLKNKAAVYFVIGFIGLLFLYNNIQKQIVGEYYMNPKVQVIYETVTGNNWEPPEGSPMWYEIHGYGGGQVTPVVTPTPLPTSSPEDSAAAATRDAVPHPTQPAP